MRTLSFLLLFFLFLILTACEPVRYTTKIEPFTVESPKETPQVKKLPYEAIILLDDSKKFSNTYYDYNFGVIHTVEFPIGNLLKQILPIYFDQMFSKTKYVKALSSSVSPNTLIIDVNIDTINFVEKNTHPISLEIIVWTRFLIYDSDFLPITLPLLGYGSGKIQKAGLLAVLDKKDYQSVFHQAVFNSLKNATDEIFNAVINPKAQILEAKDKIKKDPTNIFSYKVVANLSLKNNDIPEALAASQMHIQLAPKNPDGYLLLYKCYLAQRKYKDALLQLEHALSLAPKSGFLLEKLVDTYIENNKYDKAIEALKRYIEQRPDDKYAPLYLAKIYYQIGKYDEAIKISEKTLESLSFSGIGVNLEKKEGQYPKIVNVQNNSPAQKVGLQVNYEIIEIEGKSTSGMKINEIIQAIRGKEGTEIKLKTKKPESEEISLLTVTRQKFYIENVAGSYMGLIALNYLEKGEKTKAKKYLDEADMHFPKDTIVGYAKALFYLRERQNDKALTLLTSSLKNDDFVEALKAITFSRLGKYDESINLFKKISNSKNIFITERLRNELISSLSPYAEHIERKAYEYEKAGQYRQALKEYAKLIEISGNEKAQKIRTRVASIINQNPLLIELSEDARKHFINAEVLFMNNKFEEALEELAKVLQFNLFNPQIYFNKALIYEKMSDFAKAIENMEIYLQLNPRDPKAQAIKDQIYKWRFILEKEI